MLAAADAVPAELDELDPEQRDALDVCVIAAMTWCSTEGDARARARLLMECHGRYLRACGVFGKAASFPDFLSRLRAAPVGELLPGPGSWSKIWDVRLLADDGTATPALTRLALEVSAQAQQVPGLGADLRHVHSVLRALGKLPSGARLSRITAEAVQHAVFRALRQAGFTAYTTGREALVTTPVLARRGLATTRSWSTSGCTRPSRRCGSSPDGGPRARCAGGPCAPSPEAATPPLCGARTCGMPNAVPGSR